MHLNRPVRVALLLAVLTAAGCATGQPVAAGPGTVVEVTALITTSTTTTTRRPTTTTSGKPTTTRKGTPRSTVKPEAARSQLRDEHGITFDARQGRCLGDAFSGKPELLDVLAPDYAATTDEARRVLDILMKCLGGQRPAVHALIETMQADGRLDDAQGRCLEELLATVPRGDLAPLTAGDKAVGEKYSSRLRTCVSTTAS